MRAADSDVFNKVDSFEKDETEIDPPAKKKPLDKDTTKNLKKIPIRKFQGGYVGQGLDDLITLGIQKLGEAISGSDISKETSGDIQLATTVLVIIASKGKNGKADGELAEQVSKLADDVPVVRGGSNTAEAFEKESGVSSRLSDRSLDGISVNSKAGKTVKELSQGVPHGKVGTTTVGQIRKAGGDFVPSPTRNNPNHATMSIPNSKKASEVMTVIKNPTKQ